MVFFKFRLDADELEWIVCVGMQDANETVWEKFMQAEIPLPNYWHKSRANFIKCSKNDVIREKYISFSLQANETDDAYFLMDLVKSFFKGTKDDVDFILNYYINHFDDINNL